MKIVKIGSKQLPFFIAESNKILDYVETFHILLQIENYTFPISTSYNFIITKCFLLQLKIYTFSYLHVITGRSFCACTFSPCQQCLSTQFQRCPALSLSSKSQPHWAEETHETIFTMTSQN